MTGPTDRFPAIIDAAARLKTVKDVAQVENPASAAVRREREEEWR